jgi:predicted hydrolase (HD superfamily)
VDPLRELLDVTERLDIIKGHAAAVDKHRRELIRAALAADVPVVGIVTATGLTRRQVNQIRDGR